MWEERRLGHVERFVEKGKILRLHYAATFIKPKDLEKQDLNDDDVWSPTSHFEVEYWGRLMKKNRRERLAREAAAENATAMAVGDAEAVEGREGDAASD